MNEKFGIGDEKLRAVMDIYERNLELEAENAELKERVAMLDVTAVYKSLGEMGCIEQVANLKAENAAFQARIAELEAAQRWHVVADGELPIVGKSIMFYDSSSGEIYRGVYTASHHWRANYFSEKCGTVTRWMPLPEPPEVQE